MRFLLIVGLLAFAVGLTTRYVLRPAPIVAKPDPVRQTDVPAPPVSTRALWSLLWTRPAPLLRDLSVSDDGTTVTWVDSRGSVRRINGSTGGSVWQAAPIRGIDRVLATSNGGVIAYSWLNPTEQSVHFFRPAPAITFANGAQPETVAFDVRGAVWSVASVAEPDGSSVAAAGTGQSLLYILPLSAPTRSATASVPPPPTEPTPVPALPIEIGVQGIPCSLDLATSVDSVTSLPGIVAGTWQDAGISAWSSSGKPLWRPLDDPRPDRQFDVHVSADGSTIVAVSTKRPLGSDARVKIKDARSGVVLSSEILGGTEVNPVGGKDVLALVGAHGTFIALSYSLNDGTDDAMARRVVLLNRKGYRRFPEMGGRFFAPRLVALATSGNRARMTVRDSGGYLLTIDETGRILSRFKLDTDSKTGTPPRIERTVATRDGKFLLIQRGDGQISYYKASPI